MQILFALLIALFGALFVRHMRKGAQRTWMLILTLWLSVPIGFIVEPIVGYAIADWAGCPSPSAAREIECFIGGWNVSPWMNGLVFAGYAFAFIAFPWFAIGGVCVLIFGLVSAFRK